MIIRSCEAKSVESPDIKPYPTEETRESKLLQKEKKATTLHSGKKQKQRGRDKRPIFIEIFQFFYCRNWPVVAPSFQLNVGTCFLFTSELKFRFLLSSVVYSVIFLADKIILLV